MAKVSRAQVPQIVLELTDTEAEVVKHLTGAVLGTGEGRKIADGVWDALDGFGIPDNNHGLNGAMRS